MDADDESILAFLRAVSNRHRLLILAARDVLAIVK